MMDENTLYMHILKSNNQQKNNSMNKLGKVTKNCKKRANYTSMINLKA